MKLLDKILMIHNDCTQPHRHLGELKDLLSLISMVRREICYLFCTYIDVILESGSSAIAGCAVFVGSLTQRDEQQKLQFFLLLQKKKTKLYILQCNYIC